MRMDSALSCSGLECNLRWRLYSTTSPQGVTKSYSTRRTNPGLCLDSDVKSWQWKWVVRFGALSFTQSPLRLRANSHSVERSHGCHGNCSSLPREARVQAIPRAKGSPVHTYTSVEITNVWNDHCRPHFSSSCHSLRSDCIVAGKLLKVIDVLLTLQAVMRRESLLAIPLISSLGSERPQSMSFTVSLNSNVIE